ncbi:MAG TPA: hypothetical protein VNE38_10315 [Ktedonobacteraceae bacterium]|nr:hypothetical protein [Ktedonobacteraceae bacterium]
MSQQEFAPGPQSQKPEGEDEIYQPQYPYSWSGNRDEAAPRDEPPSSYEYNTAAMEQGYQAQDSAGQQQVMANPYEYQQGAGQIPPPYQYDPYSSDGDAYQQGYGPSQGTYNANNAGEQGYSPYNSPYNNAQNNQGQGVPPWARPQRQNYGPFRFGWIIFVLIFLSMGGGFLRSGFFFFGFGHALGFIILPIFILMLIASAISRSMWRGSRGGRRRGPWGW